MTNQVLLLVVGDIYQRWMCVSVRSGRTNQPSLSVYWTLVSLSLSMASSLLWEIPPQEHFQFHPQPATVCPHR